MPQEQEVLHIHMIKLTLAAKERKKREKRKEENYINCDAFRALHVFNAFLFFVCSKRFTYNLKSFIKCAKFGLH